MLSLSMSLILACPPTSIPDEVPEQGAHFIPSPYGQGELGPTPALPRDAPTPDELPLWDLEASAALVEAALASDDPPDWAPWLAWSLAEARDQRATAHDLLIAALASPQLDAARLGWWYALEPLTPDDVDALTDAYAQARSPQTRSLLSAALTIANFDLSCPVEPAADGACRRPEAPEQLLRRDPVRVESARAWAERHAEHQRELGPDERDLAARAWELELERVADGEDYEALLVARMPDDLDFTVEGWMKDSGVHELEQRYRQQVHRAEASRRRAAAYSVSYFGCARELAETNDAWLEADAEHAALGLLRQAQLELAAAQTLSAGDGSSARERRRLASEGIQVHVHPSHEVTVLETLARETLERCVQLGRQQPVDAETHAACLRSLEELAPDKHAPVDEIVPGPRSSTSLASHGVVGADYFQP